MSLSPDQRLGPGKEHILANAPFLKNYLDSYSFHARPAQWNRQYVVAGEPLEQVFDDVWGRQTIGVFALQRMRDAEIAGFFKPVSVETKLRAIADMMKIGLELSHGGHELFLEDLFATLYNAGLSEGTSQEPSPMQTSFMAGLLFFGTITMKRYREGIRALQEKLSQKIPLKHVLDDIDEIDTL